jgi:hypothetical protein
VNALDALNRARAAWERTQPQLTIVGLDQADAGTDNPVGVGLIEPVRLPGDLPLVRAPGGLDTPPDRKDTSWP